MTTKMKFLLAPLVLGLLVLSGCGKKEEPSKVEQSKSVQPAVLSIMYNSEEQQAEKSVIAQLVQSQLKEKGIEVRLDPVPNTLYNDRITKGDFEAVLSLWYLDYHDAEGFLTDFYSKAGYRLSRYNDPEYDKQYQDGLFAMDEKNKNKFFRQAADKLKHDLPWVPLFSNSEIFLMKPEAEGFKSNAYQYYDYRDVKLAQIRAATDIEVQTLDPAQVYDLASKHLATQSYEGLVTMDAESHIVPQLASSWEFSPNNDMLTFKLRQGVTFHPAPFIPKGSKQMSSQDVKASFERLIRSNSPYTYIFDYVQGVADFKSGKAKEVAGFQAIDPHTFRIALTRPLPTMLPWLLAPAAYVLPKELPEKYDFSKGSVGTGPFILKTWDGVTARFESNPKYWVAGHPVAKGLTLRVIKDTNTMTAAFHNGELDILNVPVSYYSQVFNEDGTLKSDWKNYVYREVKLNNLKLIAFNMDKTPWGKDQTLRQKFSEAIGRDAIVQHLLKGKGRADNSVIPAGFPGFD